MTRPLRIEYPGAVYHVTGRGNAKRSIFHGKTDREAFLEILKQARTLQLALSCLLLNVQPLPFSIETIDPFLSHDGYRRFVSQGVSSRVWKGLKGQIYLGSDAFIQGIPHSHIELGEIPRVQRLASALRLTTSSVITPKTMES